MFIKIFLLSIFYFVPIFSIQFSAWPANDLSLSSNDANAINSNFLEFSDLPSSAASDDGSQKDFEVEPPTAEEAEAAAASATASTTQAKAEPKEIVAVAKKEELENGQRASDEFNPETIAFQDDESEEYHCSNFPNQTLIRPHFFSCNSPVRPPILVVHDSAVSNKTGDYQFPLDFSQTVRFFFDVTSFATRRYDNLRAEVYLYRRKTGWLGCGWLFLPTFGIIDNYDVCEDNLSCPVYPGRQVIEVSINPKIAFSGIFKMVHNKHAPYQLIIRLVNNRSPTEELMCVVYQSRIDF